MFIYSSILYVDPSFLFSFSLKNFFLPLSARQFCQINQLSFCLSENGFISPSFLKEILLNIEFQVGSFFLSTFYLQHTVFACIISGAKSEVILTNVQPWVRCSHPHFLFGFFQDFLFVFFFFFFLQFQYMPRCKLFGIYFA